MTFLSVGCPGSSDPGDESNQILVLSASNLSAVLPEIAADFTEKTGVKVILSFGSSGQLSQQILQGGKADVFISADRQFIDKVLSEDRAFEDTRSVFAVVPLVMWWMDGNDLPRPDGLDDLEAEEFKRIAISNPKHVPTGIAAKAALEGVGVFKAVEQRLVFGENATQTIQFARSGNADVAIVPRSLAFEESDGEFALIDPKLHEPLEQEAVALKDSDVPGVAAEFIAFLSEGEAQQKLVDSGFEVQDVISID